MRDGIMFARNKVAHRPRFDSPLHFDFRNIREIGIQKHVPADMFEQWLQVCRVKITFTLFQANCFVSATIN